MTETPEFLLRLDEAHAHSLSLANQTDPQREVYPGWKIKDLLAHVAGWDEAGLAGLRAHAAGQPGSIIAADFDAYNARMVAKRQALSLEELLQQWEQTRAELKRQALAMPAELAAQPFLFPWGEEGTVEEMLLGLAAHEAYHAREVDKLLSP